MSGEQACICPDPWCPEHATCGACVGKVIILDDDDPAFCPTCGQDVMPSRACRGGVRPWTALTWPAWHAEVAAQRARNRPAPDLLAAFLADVATDVVNGNEGEMQWPATTAALQAEEDNGLQCDRCGLGVMGITRWNDGQWLCDPCVAIVDGPEPDEDYADDVFPGWDQWAELLDDMRKDDR